MKKLLRLLPVLLAGFFYGSADGATLFSNLGQADDGDPDGIGATVHIEASEFQTGLSASVLTGLTIRVYNGDSILHTFEAALYADSGFGSPGSLLATFGAVDNLIGPAVASKDLTYSHAGFNLAANTRYWIAVRGLQNAVSSSYAWRDTLSDAEDAGSVFTNDSPPLRYLSVDGAATWPSTRVGNSFFAIEGTVVPEPSPVLLSVLGVVILMQRGRRRAARSGRA